MPKFKQRRRKLKAKAKRLFKRKEASHFRSNLVTPPPPPPSPERAVIPSTDIPISRSWLRLSWNFRFPSFKNAIKLWTNRVWSIYSWCQSCMIQSLEALKNTVFPSRLCHQELRSLKQRFCILEDEVCKLQEALKAGPLKKNGPMQITVKDLLTVKLKKTQSLDERRMLVPSPKVQNPLVTVSDLQRVTLKPKSKVLSTRVTNVLITPGKSQLDLRKLLRKVDVERSPGGTPLTNKENLETGTGLTPVMTRALKRKFQQDPGDSGPGVRTEAGAVGEAGGAGDPGAGAGAGDPIRGGVTAAEGNRTEPGSQDYSLLQAYYNQESKVLYLLLTSICDNSQLLRACRALQSGEAGGGLSLPHAEAHEFWKHQEKVQCLSLLYLFSVCHILLLVHPTCSFDITYDRVFRALDGLRQKVLPLLKTAIKDCPVGKDWKLNCRPCPPRLLFLFQLNGTLKVEPPRNQDPAHPDKPKKHSPKRRLQHALEDQIYRIFRKSRVLTNQSINCLFTVPANQAFVYIVPGSQEEDPVGMLLDQLKSHCTVKDPESLLVPAPLSGSRRYQVMRQHSRQQLSFHTDTSSSSSSGQLVDFTLREFLWQHVELVLSKKGFDDSVGRNPQPSHFELPTYQKWISAASKLYEVAIDGKEEDPASPTGELTSKILSSIKVLEGFLDIDTKFSENRCQKALPMAHSAYQSNLPHNYTMTVHKNQLAQALRVYSQHARGPAFHKYAMQLHEDCYKFWSNGHQLCEERSLTDQHCVHKFHSLPKSGS
ncbi:hypothetical protein G4228_004197 [Cervus hanglu yarkandensis]|nr:hypothetical protein G4228_004197 [Cervus hanglu yarkandensis]